jgi:transposase
VLAGQDDPAALAELARGRLRAKIPALREALTGWFRVAHHGLLVAQMLAHIDFLDAAIAELDTSLERARHPRPGPRRWSGHRPAPTGPARRRGRRTRSPTDPSDATAPGRPGARRRAASAAGRTASRPPRAEDRPDVGQPPAVPHPGHLASWAGLCPNINTSGGSSRSGRTRHGSVALRTALTEAGHAAARTKNTYLAAHHAHIRGRRGLPNAIGATRHDLLIAYWHVVHDQVDYADLGPDWAQRRRSTEHRTRRLVHQLERLGHIVTLESNT